MRGPPGCATIDAVKHWFIALVWLLTLALPLQALAVASPSMGFGSMHDVPAVSGMTDMADMHGADAQAPCHGVDMTMTDDAPGPHAGCAQCAVCHAGAAPAPQPGTTPCVTHHGEAPPAWQAPAPATVDLAGLDRPPRTHRV